METSVLTVDIDARGFEPVKTIFELLLKYQDQLPEELLKSLLEAADCDACEIGYEQWQNMTGGKGEVETDFTKGEVASINTILKRVSYYDGHVRMEDYPEKFKIGVDGKVLVSWGYDGS